MKFIESCYIKPDDSRQVWAKKSLTIHASMEMNIMELQPFSFRVKKHIDKNFKVYPISIETFK